MNQLLLFAVAGQTYALHLDRVDRVLRMVEVTHLPQAPNVVEGIINIQGEVVPVVSIRRRLGLAHRKIGLSDSLVLARARATRVAIVAESVLGMNVGSADDVVGIDEVAHGIQNIQGVLRTSDGLVLIHDISGFFSPEEEQSLTQALDGLKHA